MAGEHFILRENHEPVADRKADQCLACAWTKVRIHGQHAQLKVFKLHAI
jgi:hypothetical protein